MTTIVRFQAACATALWLLGSAGAADAQTRQGPARRNAAEVQRLFDAYTLAQAQDALKLTDAQYPEFVARMKALQDVRHRNQQARFRLLRQIARLTSGGDKGNEGDLRGRLNELREHDARAAAELEKAYAALDEVLDTRQQARFRLFEESIERKKFDLLARARQRGRARLP
jgi:hypothetical protein